MKDEPIRCPKERLEIIENLQTAILDAGGRFFKQQELLDMTFEELLNGFLPNAIRFSFKYKKFEDGECGTPELPKPDKNEDDESWHEERRGL